MTTARFGLLQPELAELDPEVKQALITLYSTLRVRYRVCALGPAAHARYLLCDCAHFQCAREAEDHSYAGRRCE